MGRRRILSDAQLEEMVRLWERGWSAQRVADHFADAGTKVSAGSITWHALRLGADRPVQLRGRHTQASYTYRRGNHEVRPFSAEEDAKLCELDQRGERLKTIAAQLGRPHNSVRGRLMTLARRDARADDRQVVA